LVRKAGKREDRKPDSLLEEKGRAMKEPEDDRGRPADRYRSHPSKHTDREYFFLTNPLTLLILASRTSLSVSPTMGPAWQRARDQGKL